jgi:hypothetical protein
MGLLKNKPEFETEDAATATAEVKSDTSTKTEAAKPSTQTAVATKPASEQDR